jgi:hypothetical protein
LTLSSNFLSGLPETDAIVLHCDVTTTITA